MQANASVIFCVWNLCFHRPFGSRSKLGPLPSKIVFPFTIQLPKWYWDAEDERSSTGHPMAEKSAVKHLNP